MIYRGEFNTDINCASCHGKDGKPVKKGARDLRDPKNTTRYSDSYWFWRVAEGVPMTKMKAWKGLLSEQQFGRSSPISTCTRTTGSRPSIRTTSHNHPDSVRQKMGRMRDTASSPSYFKAPDNLYDPSG